MITFQNVYKEYKNGVQALMDINMEIPYGQFVFIVGASGAGKSSLIKLLICEEKVSRGHIYVNNKDITELSPWYIPKLRRQVGVVFQDFRLLQKKTAYENVAYALEIVGESGRTIKKRVPEVLELVGLSDKLNSYPGELSGGEGQRLAIARAIVNKPPVFSVRRAHGKLGFRDGHDRHADFKAH